MSGKPEDAAKRDVAALAAELAGQIASLSAFAGSGLASQGFTAARPGLSAGVPAYGGSRAMLENAARFVSPALPAGAALRPVKAALLRVLRIVTRDQTTFNSALLEALRGALLETEASLNGFASVSAEAREAARHAEAATVAARERLERVVTDLSDLSVRVGREAAARALAGRGFPSDPHREIREVGDHPLQALPRRDRRGLRVPRGLPRLRGHRGEAVEARLRLEQRPAQGLEKRGIERRLVPRDDPEDAQEGGLDGAQRGPGGEYGRHEARGVFQHRPRTRERGSPGRGTGARPRKSL